MDAEDNKDDLKIGDYNDLEVLRFVDFGAYLHAGDFDILLPKRKIPENTSIGEVLTVFVYNDSEGREIATTDTPKIKVNECGFLEVMDVNKYGAFLDWGIENQLLVPYREQVTELKEGQKYMVYMYLDKVSMRLVATTRIEKHLSKLHMIHLHELHEKDKVDLYIYQKTDMGYKAVINQKNMGLLYENELKQKIHVGERVTGYIKQIRESGKVDLSLEPIGFDRLSDIQEIILNYLKDHNGALSLNDKSSPEEIKQLLKMSKGDFKKAIGMLWKQKKIKISPEGITLITLSDSPDP
ncbi:MAG: S1-like domain-containing RNA-binding protein [Leptospirales bacterium]